MEVTLSSRNVGHYESLGYDIPRRRDERGRYLFRRGDKIRVDVKDLLTKSTAIVTKVCDNCSIEIPNQEYGRVRETRTDGRDYCQSCSYVKDHNRLALIRPDIADEFHTTKNGELTAYDFSVSSAKRVWWLCSKPGCGYEWNSAVYSRTIGSGCPSCNESHGERFVRHYLSGTGVFFKTQVAVTGLVGLGGGQLMFDFAITDDAESLTHIIEYDGAQHYVMSDGYFGGKDGFNRTREHDRRKDEWCHLNGVSILRIRYDVPTDEIPAMIDEFLQGVNVN